MTHPFSRSAAIALLVAGALFMENLDGTVLVTALPQMAASFGVLPVDLNIGVSAYLLTLAVLIPASGWAADRFGARRVFAAAIAVFTGASLLCGLSDSLAAFVLARILQGAGGAMMVPVGRLAVLRFTEKHDLIRAIATLTWPALVAPLLGPPVGGFITTYASWRWIFLLNLPLGVAAFALALRLIPAGGGAAGKPFDRLGFILSGGACFAVMYGLDLISGRAASGSAGGWLLAGAIAGGAFVGHARRQAHPLFDLGVLGIRSYGVTIWAGSLFRMAITAIPFLLPLLFQVGFGLSAFVSGLLLLAVFAGNLAMKPLTTPVLRRFTFRSTLMVNGTLNALATFACAFLSPATPVPLIAALLFVSGLTRSMQFTALNTLAFADVPAERMSDANTLFNATQQMAMGMAIAFGAIALRVAEALRTGGAGGNASLADFHAAFAAVGVLGLTAVLGVLALDHAAGEEVRRRKTAAKAN